MIKENQNLQFLVCANCNGLGRIGDQKCDNCQEKGIIAYLNGKILVWDRKIDQNHLKAYKIEKIVNTIIFTILVIMAILGFLSMVIIILMNLGINHFIFSRFSENKKRKTTI